MKVYPKNLAGIFEVDYENLKLKAVKLIDSNDDTFCLQEIRFQEGVGLAIFDNGAILMFNIKLNLKEHQYEFDYMGIHHLFKLTSTFYGADKETEILLMFDFNEI